MTSPVSDAMKRVKAVLDAAYHEHGPPDPSSIWADVTFLVHALELRGMKAKEEASPEHGQHCSDYAQACRQCLDRFNEWKRGEASPADEVERLTTAFKKNQRIYGNQAVPMLVRALLSAIRNTPQAIEEGEVERLREAGDEMADKLWILRCDSRDAPAQEAAERALDMWRTAKALLPRQALSTKGER